MNIRSKDMLVVNVRCDGEVKQLEEKAIMPEKKDHLLSDASSDLESSDFVSKNAQNRKRVGSYKISPTDSSQELMEPITHSHIDYDMIDLK